MNMLVHRIAKSFAGKYEKWSNEKNFEKTIMELEYLLFFAKKNRSEFLNYVSWQLELLEALEIDRSWFTRLYTTAFEIGKDEFEAKQLENFELLISFEENELVNFDSNREVEIPENVLAKFITENHINLFKEIDDYSKESDYDKIYSDTESHLKFLKQAIETKSEVLFTEYLSWLNSTLSSLGIESITVVRYLVSMRMVISHSVLKEGVSYIDTGLRSIIALGSISENSSHGYVSNEYSRKYLDLILEGKRKEATDYILELADNDVDLKYIYINIFQETQYEIGRLWEKNKVSVAQEHYCTATTQMIMSMLYPRLFNQKRNGKSVVATCVGSELHELGVRMIADFLEINGWDTYYIGANAPSEAIIDAIEKNEAVIVAISVTLMPHIARAQQVISEIRKQYPDIKILVGGYPFKQDRDLFLKIGADGFALSAEEVNEIAFDLINE